MRTRRRSTPGDFDSLDSSPFLPEQHLCAAIIITALLDLGIDVERTNWKELRVDSRLRRNARQFFLRPDGEIGDFNFCCEACDIPPAEVIRLIKPFLNF